MRTSDQQWNRARLVEHILEEVRSGRHRDEDALRASVAGHLDEFLRADAASALREVTILFSDIRGFTSIAENHEADRIVRTLNTYFAHMNEVILRNGGVIDKYIGDAILTLFGADEPRPDDARRAVACAIEMQIAMNRVNRENKDLGLPELFVGIGINTGVVSVGNIGSDLHHEYTVIGDGVNLASRIESHSLRGQVLISHHTYERVKDVVEIGALSTVSAKGKSEPVRFFDVLGMTGNRNIQVPRREVRTSIRIDVDSRFTFQVIAGKEVLPAVHDGLLRDISYNGFFAVVADEIAPFTDIQVALTLALIGGQARTAYAKVMSVRALTDGFGCGVQFTALDPDCQQAIKDFIDRIIESR